MIKQIEKMLRKWTAQKILRPEKNVVCSLGYNITKTLLVHLDHLVLLE
jgi:hypothetical protein